MFEREQAKVIQLSEEDLAELRKGNDQAVREYHDRLRGKVDYGLERRREHELYCIEQANLAFAKQKPIDGFMAALGRLKKPFERFCRNARLK